MVKPIFGSLLALAIVACSSVPIYEPARSQSDFGYSDQKLEENRFRVSYNGTASTPRATVENFLLYRMSEITLEQDHDYFKVIETDTECHTEYRTIDDEPCPRGERYAPMFPYCGFGYVCNPAHTIKETKRYEAVAYITLHLGEKPAEDPYAFSARAVQDNLQSQIVRP